MKQRFWLGFLAMLCVMGMMLIPVYATKEPSYSWYCPRNKNHQQPLADKDMQFIEQLDGYYIDRFHGDEVEEKVVYLTFDAGYENGNVEKILNVLSEERVTGAFFILGNLINRNPELVKRMAEEGHVVANHTNHHPDMTKKENFEDFEKEILELETLYREATGKELDKYYRPPEGKFNRTSLEYAKRMGYKTVFWSFAYADWDNGKQPDREVAKKKILDHVHNGAVILLHPTSATNAAILGEVIQALKSEGYRFGSLHELTVPRLKENS